MEYPYGKNILLTGGSSGIGLAAASLLAAKGYTVYAASRNPGTEIQTFTRGGDVRPVKMDVCDPASVDEAASHIQADIGIVVHCAGIGIACAGEDYPQDAVSRLMKTNFDGVLLVNSRFLPRLRGRGRGLCVIIGSVAGVFSVPYQSHYSASKAALDSYASALRMELRDFGIRVSLIMPGDTSTGFTGARTYDIDEASPHYKACRQAVRKMEKDEIGGRPPESVARSILKICGRKSPPLRRVIGFEYKLMVFFQRLLPHRLIEYILWKMYITHRDNE